MDVTKIKDMLINPVADKVAEILSPRIAEMVTDILKKEILEAQKYRIDKEFEFKQREQNLKFPNFCPQCNVFTQDIEPQYIGRIGTSRYKCSCGMFLGSPSN